MDKKIEKKNWTWQKIALYAAVVAGAGYFLSTLWKDAGTSKLNVETERLLIDTIHQGVFQEFIPVTGIVQPIKTVFIAAIEGGRVEEKFVEDGVMVRQGQPILRLSNPNLQLNYLNQEANTVAQINQIRNTSLMMEQQSLTLREQALDVTFNIDLFTKRNSRNQELYQAKGLEAVPFPGVVAKGTPVGEIIQDVLDGKFGAVLVAPDEVVAVEHPGVAGVVVDVEGEFGGLPLRVREGNSNCQSPHFVITRKL